MAYQTIISASECNNLIEGGRPSVVVDCRFSLADPSLGRQQYLAGHLPGAVYAGFG